VLTETTQERYGLVLLRGGQSTHEMAEALDMGREYLLNQLAPWA